MDKYTKYFIEKYQDVYDDVTDSISLHKIAGLLRFYDITHQYGEKTLFISEFNSMLNYNRRKDKIKRILDEN